MMHHFDPEQALELIEREKIGTFGGVPAMVMQVLDSPNFSKFDTSSIRAVSYGGAPAPPDLVRRIREAWPIGQPSNGYGLTETSSVTSMNTGDDYVARPESVGPPVPVCDVAVVPEDFTGDEPDGTLPRGPDVRGELWIKGPNVVRGYWKRPQETAETFTRGWLHTGDVARLDEDDFIYIVDRAKDMIIRGGENVYSVQVEAALFEHPAVADCAVIGVPDPTLGEEVGAVIVLRPGAKVTADELQLHVKARLAGFMVPTRIWFRTEPLPRNPQGKVLKRELRDGSCPRRPEELHFLRHRRRRLISPATRTCRPRGPARATITPTGGRRCSSAVGLWRHPQVGLQGLPALGEAALGVVVAERRDDDDVLAVLPVDRRGHRVVGRQLQRVEDADDLVHVAPGRGRIGQRQLDLLVRADDEDRAHGQGVVGVGVDHVVEVRHLAVLVADQREGQGRPCVSSMSPAQPLWDSTESTERPISLALRLSNSGLALEKAPSSVVQTGVKSLGWEKRIPQLSPSHSWKLIVPVGGVRREVGGGVPQSYCHVLLLKS